jgi:hypothetical protein
MEIRKIIDQRQFSDSPNLSDLVLLPAVASGHDITIVSGFLPSYVLKLVRDVVASPQIEPGKIHLILCTRSGSEMEDADSLARLMLGSGLERKELEDFMVDSLSLIDEGGMSLELLLSRKGDEVTRSCIGKIALLDGASACFVDQIPGDFNGGIKFSRTWSDGAEARAGQTAGEFVYAARYDSWAGVRRADQASASMVMLEIAQRNLLARVSGTLEPQPAIDWDDDFDEVAEFEELEALLASDEDSEFLLKSFINFPGESVRDLSWFLNDPERLLRARQHAPSLPEDLYELVGASLGTCWCGIEFDRRYGCSG